MHGLWSPDHTGVHVAVAGNASRLPAGGVVLHWARGPVPVGSHDGDEPLINVLFHASRCLARADALAIWESALRKRLMTPDELGRVRWRSARAAELARFAGVLSDSGVESTFVELMRAAGIPLAQQVWIDGHPVDALIGRMLVVQLDGFAHHSTPKDRRRDLQADARLTLRGYTVLRFDYQQVFFDSAYVVETVRMAIAQGLHNPA